MVKGLSDATRVVFDDERAVANAGMVLPAMLADRLGIVMSAPRILIDLTGSREAAYYWQPNGCLFGSG